MGHKMSRQATAGTELALVALGGFQVEAYSGAVADCRQVEAAARLTTAGKLDMPL